jgi:hypothetical protein
MTIADGELKWFIFKESVEHYVKRHFREINNVVVIPAPVFKENELKIIKYMKDKHNKELFIHNYLDMWFR